MKFLLTFDLEGSNNFNNNFLSKLENYDLESIFFAEGRWAKKFPKQLLQISDKFILGNHSFSHVNFRKIGLKDQILEIEKCDNVLSEIRKQKMKFFRAPYFHSNEMTLLALKKLKYQYDSSIKSFFSNGSIDIEGVKELCVNSPTDYFLFRIMHFPDKLALGFIKKFLIYHRLKNSVVIFDFHPTQEWGIKFHMIFFHKLLKYLKENFIAYNL